MTKFRLSSVLVFSLLAFTVACKKDSDSVNIAESTMSFKIDGVEKTYSNCLAYEQKVDSLYGLSFEGVSAGDLSTTMVGLVSDKKPIVSGYHVTESFYPGSDDVHGLLGYGMDSTGYSNINIEDVAKQQIDIHITEKTATNVKGTFSGKLYSESDETKVHLITEGKFNAKLLQQ